MTVNVLLFTGSYNGLTRPAGAYRIATELRKYGYSVQVIDYFMHMTEENSDMLFRVIDKFVGPNTLWVGFSSTFFVNRRAAVNAIRSGKMTVAEADDGKLSFTTNGVPIPAAEQLELRKLIRDKSPNAKLVFGGAKAHSHAAGIIDAYIEGYADTTIIEFTKWVQGKNPFFTYKSHPGIAGQTIPYISVDHDTKASGFDFNSSQILWDRTDCIQHGESLPIEVSRGCIFNCKFCSYPLNGKKRLDFLKEPDKLVEELTRNYELYGTTQYIYSDDTHNDSVDKLRSLYDDVYSKLPFKIGFYTYIRLDLLAAHKDCIGLLKESGIRGAFFGIESLNYESAKAIGKGLKPEKALETLHEVRSSWGDDVKTSAGFIVGLPNETKETATRWLDQITSPEFPLNCVHIYPLYISNKIESKVWKSELELNAPKYGYKFDEHGAWYNEHLSFYQARDIAADYLKLARQNKKQQIADFGVAALLNLGYTWEQLIGVQAADINGGELVARRKSMHDKYFKDILAL